MTTPREQSRQLFDRFAGALSADELTLLARAHIDDLRNNWPHAHPDELIEALDDIEVIVQNIRKYI